MSLLHVSSGRANRAQHRERQARRERVELQYWLGDFALVKILEYTHPDVSFKEETPESEAYYEEEAEERERWLRLRKENYTCECCHPATDHEDFCGKCRKCDCPIHSVWDRDAWFFWFTEKEYWEEAYGQESGEDHEEDYTCVRGDYDDA